MLSDRRCKTFFAQAHSNTRHIRAGIPQGSVLSPFLWLVYINEICAMDIAGATPYVFADDIGVVCEGDSLEDAVDIARRCTDFVQNWASRAGQTLSVDKCSH
eukprot:177887-Amphidinium_carterae.1